MNFFVEVVENGKCFNVVRYDTLKSVFASENIVKAKTMCDILNYKPKMKKAELAHILIVLGVLCDDFRNKNTLAQVDKACLYSKLERVGL